MTNSFDLNLGGIYDAVATMPFVRRLLPGPVETAETIRVDVHVRSYDQVQSLASRACAMETKGGRLPVGTFLDCYV